MKADPVWRGLSQGFGVLFAACAMGTVVGVANLPEYGPLLRLDVGTAIIGVSLLAGIALGLMSDDEEPSGLILRTFLASIGAVAIVAVTVLAPVFAGVVPSLDVLGPPGSARLAAVFTALFVLPIHVLGGVIGFALADSFAPSQLGGSQGRLEDR